MQRLGVSDDEPPCAECLPELQTENFLVYEVYWRSFNVIENIDPFKIMRMLGVDKKERLYCLDLIQAVRNEVMKRKFEKAKK